MPVIVGGSLIGLTVRRKFVLLVAAPSLTVMVIRETPLWLVAGVMMRARLVPLPPKTMFAVGTRVRLEEVPLTVRLAAAVSTSPIMKGITPVEVSSLMVWFGMAEMTGASFTELTVRRKLLLVPPLFVSVREIVIVAVPNWLASGVTVTVRFAPLPPRTMFPLGTSAGFEEKVDKVSKDTGVVSSAMVNGIEIGRASCRERV